MGFTVTTATPRNLFATAGIGGGDLNPRLILLDADLPETAGTDICRGIRRLPAHRDTPIIVVSARDDTDAIRTALDSGASDFIRKPMSETLLRHRVRSALRALNIRQGLSDSESRNRAFIQAIPDVILVVDQSGQVVERVAGSDAQAFPMDEVPDRLVQHWRDGVSRVVASNESETSEFSLGEGPRRSYFEARMVPFTGNRAMVIIRDVSMQKKANAKVYRLAFYDTLTGLPNRQSFMGRLAEAVAEAEESKSRFSVLYLDLDNFKRINDSLGHSIGDEILKAVSSRIERIVRADDFVARFGNGKSHLHLARLGGDEFTILLRNIEDPATVDQIADRIVQAVRSPILQNDHEFVVTPSIGIASYPEDGTDIDTLMSNADMAMYHAKESGKNAVRAFSGTMSIRSLEYLDLEHSLRRAINNDDLDLHFQPKLSLKTREITGVEALLRWSHPDRGPISPEKFVPIAEEAGLIIDLSEWVLHRVCRQIGEWSNISLGDIPIAMNLSGKQFSHSDVFAVITRAMREHAIRPELLQLELTESELMRDADGTIDTLSKLREAGLSIAVDDFGTGYSSLSYLKKFPIDALKIDRSFVMELEEDGDNISICGAIIALARSLHLRVIAEGVETAEHQHLLTLLQCDEMQGYYFAKPASADVTAAFIESYRKESVRPRSA